MFDIELAKQYGAEVNIWRGWKYLSPEEFKGLVKAREANDHTFDELYWRNIEVKEQVTRKIIIKDFVQWIYIGVLDSEKNKTQRIRINVELTIKANKNLKDNINNTICYNELIEKIKELFHQHIELVETVAEEIAEIALNSKGAKNVKVTVEKLDVYDDAVVGIEIER